MQTPLKRNSSQLMPANKTSASTLSQDPLLFPDKSPPRSAKNSLMPRSTESSDNSKSTRTIRAREKSEQRLRLRKKRRNE